MYIHTYIRVICIAHINSKESLCASVAKQVSFQRLFESVKWQSQCSPVVKALGHHVQYSMTSTGSYTVLRPTGVTDLWVDLCTLATSRGKRNLTVWRPYVRPSLSRRRILNVNHQGAARDVVPTIGRTNILVILICCRRACNYCVVTATVAYS